MEALVVGQQGTTQSKNSSSAFCNIIAINSHYYCDDHERGNVESRKDDTPEYAAVTHPPFSLGPPPTTASCLS